MSAVSPEMETQPEEGVSQIQCKICFFKANDKYLLTVHYKSKHEDIFNCDICDFITVSRGLFGAHTKSEHKGRTYNCGFCEYKPNQRYKLDRHFEAKHIEEKEKEFKCDQCKYETTRPDTLAQHKTVHEGIAFRCDRCDDMFSNKNKLKTHIQTRGERIIRYSNSIRIVDT